MIVKEIGILYTKCMIKYKINKHIKKMFWKSKPKTKINLKKKHFQACEEKQTANNRFSFSFNFFQHTQTHTTKTRTMKTVFIVKNCKIVLAHVQNKQQSTDTKKIFLFYCLPHTMQTTPCRIST